MGTAGRLLWVIALFLGSTLAKAYPIPRDGAELPVVWEEPVLQVGSWLRDGSAVRRQPGAERRSYLIARTASRGFARLRIRRPKEGAPVAAAILFRMRVLARDPVQLEGYGVAISSKKRVMAFVRFDHNGRRDPGARIDLPSLAGVPELEVLLWMAGPNFSVALVDGGTKDTLGFLSWSDPSYAQGQLGLFAFDHTGPEVSFELFAQAEGPPRAAPAPTTIARRWLLVLSPEQALGIPQESLPLFKQGDLPEVTGVVMVTDERGLFTLRQLGIEPEMVRPGVPFAASRQPNLELLDPAGVEAELRRLQRRYGRRTRLFEIGRTAQDRPIWALRIADRPDQRGRPTILLNAAIHGNEASTPSYVLDAARFVLEHQRDPEVRAWLRHMSMVVVPMVNPDGSHAFWYEDDNFGRKNRRPVLPGIPNLGVDLNRNFPFEWGEPSSRYNSREPASNFYFGPAAASEREVQALMALAESERFVAALSYHSAACSLIVPYTIAGVPNPEPATAWTMAEEMTQKLEHRFYGRRYEALGALYPVRGVEKDWYFHTFGTMAFLLEVPFRRPQAERLGEGVTFSRPAWRYLFARWLRGPSLAVRVVETTTHRPLRGKITLRELDLRAGESWFNDPKSGWFYHYLPQPGPYTVLVERGGEQQMQRVEAGNGVSELVFSFGDATLATGN